MTTTQPDPRVSAEEVQHIAGLSNLNLTPAEAVTMQRDLNAILEYVAELSALETASVPPMAQVGQMLGGQGEADSREGLRQDALVASLSRDAVLVSAPETDGVFFKVPKVIER